MYNFKKLFFDFIKGAEYHVLSKMRNYITKRRMFKLQGNQKSRKCVGCFCRNTSRTLWAFSANCSDMQNIFTLFQGIPANPRLAAKSLGRI